MSELLKKAREYEKEMEERIRTAERPVFHFSNPIGWMNDPNGFSEYQGEHHLFYQYYPYDTHWGPMHWGHAKSKDFVRWEYLEAALAPDEKYDGQGVFSGSALEDGEKQVLIYTGVEEKTAENGEKYAVQNQCIAVGDGTDYEKSVCNPVITGDLLPEGGSRTDFRDPKIWKEDGRYFTVAANRSADGSGQAVLFYSDDLEKWSFGSVLDKSDNQVGEMWECPDFFALNDAHVLVVSPIGMYAEGLEFHNGNNVVFLIGKYEKETMHFTRTGIQNMDYGLDFYAAQTMQTNDGRRVMIAWMQSWDNPMYPEDFLWSAMMTFPRELKFREGRICQMPARELENYRKAKVSYKDVCIEKPVELEGIRGRAVDMTLTVRGSEYGKFRMRAASDEKFYTEIIYDREDGVLTFDRTHSGHRKDTISTRSITVDQKKDLLKLRILMDLYSIEIFVNDGEKAMTSLIYTPAQAQGIVFESNGKAYLDVVKYDIEVE